MKIGIIGNGFVGNAIYHNFKNNYEFLIYDKDETKSTASHVREVCQDTKIIFVAVPTPMKQSGECDLSIIFNVMAQISYWYNDNIVVIKSTIPPGTCEKIKQIHGNMRLVFSPEFLTERNSIEDFKNCNRVIFGGENADIQLCEELLKSVFPEKSYLRTDWKTAEMVKYFINSFLATKVSYANEIKQICDAVDVNYKEVKDLALWDKRIGPTHLGVPGPDGSMGFGGTCFPKDLNCLIYFACKNDVEPLMLKSVWEKNLSIRENRDWLSKYGRSITENKRSKNGK